MRFSKQKGKPVRSLERPRLSGIPCRRTWTHVS
ncbi:hypothetical protein LEMLEM_LOCUS2896 [Lemmus lemmus]